ncbi:ethanolamine ammonia-lyase subunit EutB [Thalassotalea sp. G20_0]|uniref:ethanolamine ammonia-lyase subunit EutB n=2 Tax=Gammaproteobacteria TaxID=1236 RepID=UPI001AD9FCC1|nr:ethanolamine ammonia-lyase subunit EutB [Thalassotalea sp. G20_0]MBO9495582.1 ethanolamine ammonia-lyase subunit EutB [Thalassotalea sp. G20_0]
MLLKTKLFGKVYSFSSIKEVLAKANEKCSGDVLAGIAAESITEMVAAKDVLSRMLLSDLRNNPVVPYEVDEVTRIIQDDVNERIYSEIKNWSVGELREWLLSHQAQSAEIRRISRGLTSEMIAAVANIHDELLAGLSGSNDISQVNSVGVIEFFSVASAVIAADAAAKAADVKMIEVRLAMAIGGKSFIVMTGELSAVNAAVDAGVMAARDAGMLIGKTVIPSPTKEFFQKLL